MGVTTELLSEKPAHGSVSSVRDVVSGFVGELGLKRGLHRASTMLGVSERWARGLLYGEPSRIDVEVFLRAVEAQRVLRAERRARLLRELAELGDADA